MKTIVVVTGARGAGKSTVTAEIEKRGSAKVLKPFTTRARRGEDDTEYHFHAEKPADSDIAWHIERSGIHYGMLKSEIDAIADGAIGLTVFDPLQLERLADFKNSNRNLEVLIVGLDTIMDAEEQARRTAADAARVDPQAGIDEIRKRLRLADVTFTGSEAKVLEAVDAVCRLMSSRHGVVTREFLKPMILAGAVLKDADDTSITREDLVQWASYDLTVGNEVWCSEFKDLTEDNPVVQIPPYSYAIVKANERAFLPSFMVGQFDLKVSLFLSGVILSNGPQVDPGYTGDLFCLLFNGNSKPCLLKMGEHFSTIQFTMTSKAAEKYDGNYSFKKKLRTHMNSQAIIGDAGAIIAKIDNDVKAAKEDIDKKFTKLMTISGLIIAACMAITTWNVSALNSAKLEAIKATEEMKKKIEEFNLIIEGQSPAPSPAPAPAPAPAPTPAPAPSPAPAPQSTP